MRTCPALLRENSFDGEKKTASSMPNTKASCFKSEACHVDRNNNNNFMTTSFALANVTSSRHAVNADDSIKSSEDDRVTVINYDEIRRDFNRSPLNSPCDLKGYHSYRRSTLADQQGDPLLMSYHSHSDQHSHIAKDLNETKAVSMSELDNIKKETILDLKNYQRTFRSLNTRLRKKLGYDESKKSECGKKILKFERLIRKTGEANINRVNIPSLHRKYISDLFNTIVDMKWRYLLLMFILSFFCSWLFFAVAWNIVTISSDEVCVANLNGSFIDSLLFSIETQQTIGYGSRFITKDCWYSIMILMVQCGFGVVLESFMGGIVFAKLSRPKKRTETLIFSKNAVIAKRDSTYSFMCRVGDMRKSHIISAYVSMYLIKTRYTNEGEVVPWNAKKLIVGADHLSSDRLIFMPTIVEHVINAESPMYELIFDKNRPSSPNNYAQLDKFKANDFEIVVILEGTVESTGATTQARTSYLPSEILWNHVFEPLIDDVSIFNSKYNNNKNNRKATIDFSKFDRIRPIDAIEIIEEERKNYSLEEIFSIQIKPSSEHSKPKPNGRGKAITFSDSGGGGGGGDEASQDEERATEDDYVSLTDELFLNGPPNKNFTAVRVESVNELSKKTGLSSLRSKINDLSRSIKNTHC